MTPPRLPPVQVPPQDAEHLRLLGLLGYVYAGLQCFFGLFAGVYVAAGLFIIGNNEPMGWLFVGVGAVMAIIILGSAVLSFLAAKWIAQGKNWLFCIIVSGLHCASFPLGTALGVFTIIVLNRPSIKDWFVSKRVIGN